MIIPYVDNLRPEDPIRSILYAAVAKIDVCVQKSAETAYEVGALNCIGAMTKLWIDAVKLYASGKTTPFINARYGYAVEELSTYLIKEEYKNYKSCLIFNFQETHGHTRPDIVIHSVGDKKEIAWLDITSEGSIEHIKDKVGRGWETRPYVAEITYPRLDVKKINFADDKDKEKHKALLNMIDNSIQREKALNDYMILKLDAVLQEFFAASSAKTASELANVIERHFNNAFDRNYKHPIIKSMLQIYVKAPTAKHISQANFLLGGIYKAGAQQLSLVPNYLEESYRKTVLKQ